MDDSARLVKEKVRMSRVVWRNESHVGRTGETVR